MSEKAELQSSIDTRLADNNRIPLTVHRGLLKDDSPNFVDNMYPDSGFDTHLNQELLSLANPGIADFAINYIKQGRMVFISGVIENINARTSIIGSINIPEYWARHNTIPGTSNKIFQVGSGYIQDPGGDGVNCIISIRAVEAGGTTLYVKPALETGESLKFGLVYFTDK